MANTSAIFDCRSPTDLAAVLHIADSRCDPEIILRYLDASFEHVFHIEL